uniref:Uncharacterized protein n=1 Tax=Aegilops tauschii TaxID=37682 RepID=M8BIT8_AEGTA
MASQMTQAAKDKASEIAQYAKESTITSKDMTGSVLQQAGETMVNAVVGAKDIVSNTLGMGGDNTNASSTGNTATKDTTTGTTEKIVKDHH